ncbi:MAG: carbamoyltransferase HypF [Filomicrobium sp.]
MSASPTGKEGRRIKISGLVQGVGFRPTVWRLARELGVLGSVLNDGQGVEIKAWGAPSTLDAFVKKIQCDAPPLSRIDAVVSEALEDEPETDTFQIAQSRQNKVSTGIVADAATCASCLEEVFDPADRRYGYAFTNCTHCGPRLSIVEGIPYDRARTSMAPFIMCPACQNEYEDPSDRRFHAQPNACPICGPKIWLEDQTGVIESSDAISQLADWLRGGAIVAIKGIGGFHLACDATNNAAVADLRKRKHRPHKPLALMVRDLEMAEEVARLSEADCHLLSSAAAPIVLLPTAPANSLAEGIAPGQDRVGCMLPYTPLHHLLMRHVDRPIVLTSGNVSDEPQVIDNIEAVSRLKGIADYWLMHDREIINRLDDSVMRTVKGHPSILRRARGLAPETLVLHKDFRGTPNVLALGGELKSTFCLLRNGEAIVSQHVGDLKDPGVLADFRKALDFYLEAFDFRPDVIAVDRHPDYLSTREGERLAGVFGARLVPVQHHHAHLSSCLAENYVSPDDEQSLGIVFDGLGLGDDGTIWGGEFLVGGYSGFERVGHFQPVALPGGALAMNEPWRNAVAHLLAAFGPEYLGRLVGTPLSDLLAGKQLSVLHRSIEAGLNAPLSSSAGRLFEAVAAVTGVNCIAQSYEGHAAMHLESLARKHVDQEVAYPVTHSREVPRIISWASMWEALVDDVRNGVDAGRIAARFHNTLIDGSAEMAETIATEYGLKRIALSGGVLQNQILLERLIDALEERGFEVLTQARVPANDGGLSLGQAATAAVMARE